MTETPYYPHYVGDYQQKTKHLSMLEHGAYRLLLDHYYATRTPLPNDPAKLYRICGARSPAERKAVLYVSSTFFTEDETLLRNERCDSELVKLQKYSDSQSAKAKLRHGQGNATAQPRLKDSTASKNSRSEQHDFESKSSRPNPDNQLENQDTESATALPRARDQNHNQSLNPTTTDRDTSAGDDLDRVYRHGLGAFPHLVGKNPNVIREWLQLGGSVKEICFEIDKAKAKGTKVETWEYFDKAVKRAMAERRQKEPDKPREETPAEYRRWFALLSSTEQHEHLRRIREIGRPQAIEEARPKWEKKATEGEGNAGS